MTPDLIELAGRVEAATGPNRELDAAIALTQGWQRFPGDNWIGPTGGICVPSFTSSLDAAMSLVPEWAKVHLLQDTEFDNPAEKNWSANLRARSWKENDPGFGTEWEAWAATPALALTAACLRAHAAMLQEEAGR